ncbi:MAG: sugar phosphate nucleotidyltransferase [Candidatus Hodarchaeota archaeon]
MTKGIILSGGWGTRLRPLTCTTPKTLIPIVNRPVIEHQMLLLKSAGVREIILAVSVMAKEIQDYFKDGQKLGVKIHYTNEKHPMGTAGAIKLAESYLKDDNFFMLNGDVILNFNFTDMLKFHEEHGGIGTIASKMVEDPSRYGVLITDEETNQLLQFLEKDEYKPPGGKYISMPINAGVYILEPEIFSYIPSNKKVSIEREVFPKVASEMKLYHYSVKGIWMDIGKPYDLLQGNILLMKDILKNLKVKRSNLIDNSADVDVSTKIIPPCTIGENVIIRKECAIGPNVVIGDNVYIDSNSQIKNTLIYNESYISKSTNIENVIISDNCYISENVRLEGKGEDIVILASFVEISKNIRLIAHSNRSISFCHHEIVKESIE